MLKKKVTVSIDFLTAKQQKKMHFISRGFAGVQKIKRNKICENIGMSYWFPLNMLKGSVLHFY